MAMAFVHNSINEVSVFMSFWTFIHRGIVMFRSKRLTWLKENYSATVYNEILYICVIPTLWQRIREGPQILMVII